MRSVNKVLLMGNLTRDPELKKTETGKSVCNFGLATNRNYTDGDGAKHEDTDFHRLVAWNKLGELCNQYLKKGRKVYVEGRLQSHSWTDNEGIQKTATEIVIDEMIMLDNKPQDNQEEVAKQPDNQQAATV